jgi:hypothetical protein
MALPTSTAEIRAKQMPQGAVDPNVKIPQQILDAGKRSEAIQHAIAGTSEPSVATQIEGEPNGRDPNEHQEPPPQGQNQPAPVQEPPPQGTTPPEDEASWERRFKSREGRENAEIRRQRDAITQLSNRLEQMERERQVQQPQAQPIVPPGQLTEQEINDYGPEFVDVMRRVAAETASPLNEEINRLRAAMGHVQQETGNAFLQRMNQTISANIPNWAELNKDPRFIQWSQLPDVFSGAIRKSLMQDAWNSGDPQRVAAFFHSFLAEEAATNPQAGNGQRVSPPSRMVVSDNPSPVAIPPTPGAPLDLSTLAAPGRAHSAGSNPAEKPVYTAAEITKFYTDVKLGRWRGRESQQSAIDHDIMLAQREGRIIVDQRTQPPKDPYMR